MNGWLCRAATDLLQAAAGQTAAAHRHRTATPVRRPGCGGVAAGFTLHLMGKILRTSRPLAG